MKILINKIIKSKNREKRVIYFKVMLLKVQIKIEVFIKKIYYIKINIKK